MISTSEDYRWRDCKRVFLPCPNDRTIYILEPTIPPACNAASTAERSQWGTQVTCHLAYSEPDATMTHETAHSSLVHSQINNKSTPQKRKMSRQSNGFSPSHGLYGSLIVTLGASALQSLRPVRKPRCTWWQRRQLHTNCTGRNFY